MAVRFIHAADLHLDRPFSGLRGAHDEIGKRLQNATQDALERIVEICLAERVDFVIFAGDVFDSDYPSLRAQSSFVRALRRLADAGIPAFVVHGNHDAWSAWSTSLEWPELAHRFSPEHVESKPVTRGGELICQVYGTSFPQRVVNENLARKYERNDAAPHAVAVLHTDAHGGAGYAPCTVADMSADFDYWALGHYHAHQVLSESEPRVMYAGCPQGLDPGQTGERGCWLVTLEEGAPPNAEFRRTARIEWHVVPVSIETMSNEGDLIGGAVRAVERVAASSAAELVLARVELTGAGALHTIVASAAEQGGLLETLRDETRSTGDVWIESIQDRTRPEIDIDGRADGDDFVAEFLRVADEVAGDSGLLVEFAQDAALGSLTGHRELKRTDKLEITEDDLRRWVERAKLRGAGD